MAGRTLPASLCHLILRHLHFYLISTLKFIDDFAFNTTEKPRKPYGSGVSYAWTQRTFRYSIYN